MPAPRRRRVERQPQYEGAAYRELQRRFTAKLRELREARAWTQEEAGARCGMLMQQYQRIEAGGANVTFTTLARICEGFAIDVADVFDREPGATPSRSR